jgi:hypothetical protein
VTDPSAESRSEVLKILTENLTASAKVAQRLLWSCEKVSHLLPLDADKVDDLTDEQEESLDALLQRFNSLTAMVQDHITRGILTLEEEDVSKKSQRGRRELMERLGALKLANASLRCHSNKADRSSWAEGDGVAGRHL